MLTSEFTRAVTLMEEGSAEEAAAILSGIVSRLPRYAAAQIALAKAVDMCGRPSDAFREWCNAEALVSGSNAVRTGLQQTAQAVLSASVAGDVAPIDEPDEAALPLKEEVATAETEALEFLAATSTSYEHPDEDLDAEWENGALKEVVAEAEDRGMYMEESDTLRLMSMPAQPEEEAGGDAPAWHEQPHADTVSDEIEEGVAPEWDSPPPERGDGSSSDIDVSLESTQEDIELDRLIDELESARIVPRPDLDAVPEPDLSSDIDDVVSETLARIYATQKQYGEAARVYERLAIENPDRAGEFVDKAAEMRRQL